MSVLNVFVSIKPGYRGEWLTVARELFDELAKEPVFMDDWLPTVDDDYDLVIICERWTETRESFLGDISPSRRKKPRIWWHPFSGRF